jgi:hypothetical protein
MENFETLNTAFAGMLDHNCAILEAIKNRIPASQIITQQDTLEDFIALTADRISDLDGMIEDEQYRDWRRQELLAEWRAERAKRETILRRLDTKRG